MLIFHTVYKCAACQGTNQGFRNISEFENEIYGTAADGPFFCIFQLGKEMV